MDDVCGNLRCYTHIIMMIEKFCITCYSFRLSHECLQKHPVTVKCEASVSVCVAVPSMNDCFGSLERRCYTHYYGVPVVARHRLFSSSHKFWCSSSRLLLWLPLVHLQKCCLGRERPNVHGTHQSLQQHQHFVSFGSLRGFGHAATRIWYANHSSTQSCPVHSFRGVSATVNCR